MTTGRDDLGEPIQHDQLADEADLLTTLEASARVRELLRDTLRELAERERSGASDLELTNLREKVTQLEEAVQRYR
jgi:plasmid stabilization system protein ParE